MKIAICPGTFDPVTKGHRDIIERAAKLFDKVIVCVLVNPSKRPVFSVEEREDLLRRITTDLSTVEVDSYDGLLADYARIKNAAVLVKGLRAVSDFEAEFQQALANKILNPDLETMFLNTSSQYLYLSSSVVKQIAELGGDISEFIPAEICEDVSARLKK